MPLRLALAVMSGNAGAIPLLVAKGDKLDDKHLVIGMFPSPLPPQAISFDDSPMLSALLDAGISVELPDDTRFTLLDDAVIANRVEVARLLIQRGANAVGQALSPANAYNSAGPSRLRHKYQLATEQ